MRKYLSLSWGPPPARSPPPLVAQHVRGKRAKLGRVLEIMPAAPHCATDPSKDLHVSSVVFLFKALSQYAVACATF